MPHKITEVDLLITWFPIKEGVRGDVDQLDPPIAQEVIEHRRLWTVQRDLIAASNENEVWRQPTDSEELDWGLCFPHEEDIPGGETSWLVATTGDPELGVPTSMAVRLQECTRD